MEKPDLSRFPSTPGVYLYKDASGRILYVGKARRLRQRLASYFRDPAGLTRKTKAMLAQAVSIDILRTGTEKEALLLEAGLIKKHRPRYNILLRDDKEYLLFRINRDHPFPRVEILRRRTGGKGLKNAVLFGPFSSGGAARETWKLLHKFFPLRRCADRAFANRTRPCLYFDMRQCPAPCTRPVSRDDYQATLKKVELLLSGRSRELVAALSAEMQKAAESLRFEDAARLRDQIQAVRRTLERQSVVLAEGADLDVLGVIQVPEGLGLGIVFIRDGLLLDGRSFFWPGLTVEDTPELVTGFLSQFYLNQRALGESIPPRVVVPWLPPEDSPSGEEDADLAALTAALAEYRGNPVLLSRPRNPDEDNLALMAAANAREALRSSTMPAMADLLAERLHAPAPLRHIEAVDISHTGGRQTRAGLVVFQDEEPIPGAFRQYDLEEMLANRKADPGDDYAALAAWAERRAESGPPWPDLLLIDGGKGQLAAVSRAFADRGLAGTFLLASIAKARDAEGRADRRAGNTGDRIFLPGRANPLPIAPGCPELLFLQRIRDAAHNFILGRHRKARAAHALSGELTRLSGVGPVIARRLFERFGSLAAMSEAGPDALAAVPGLGSVRARLIADRLALLMDKKKA
ncbi:MAG: excinuclease ABC subunit UvrC [Desulfovibrio sp.]|jgi:excinuclease ABC subunit C|nr:excinuclease ABC subunit UvrC [Desulfovibrio sp.]